jgi:8-oxo-dGTP pyrophosphatase MutT (NUDIX family)
MDTIAIIDTLRRALACPLPGGAAHGLMMPERRRLEIRTHREWRRAAVLVLVYPGALGPALPLTRRREDLRHHGGQISFPGGVMERGETANEAALREAREEIGVDPSSVEILGSLSPLRIPPTGFEIDAVVASTPLRPAFVLEEGEVAELIEVPLATLLDPEARQSEEWEIHGGKSLVPFFRVGDHKVWGATAMVLAELLELLMPAPVSKTQDP